MIMSSRECSFELNILKLSHCTLLDALTALTKHLVGGTVENFNY